jgi:hypothetical protein
LTVSLQKAFAEAAKLSEPEQDVLAARVLAELAREDDFDGAVANSADRLASLARQALSEHESGQTQPLDPERL